MQTITIDGVIEALSPIVHFGDEKTGSSPTLRTIAVYSPQDDAIIDMPVISGNAIRGVLRRLVMADMLERVGYQIRSTKLHHALFTGGILESTDESSGALDLALRNRLRETIPPLALFGTALSNQMVRGCLIVEFAFPVCAERREYLPPALANDPRARRSVREWTAFSFKTRRDDLRAERAEDEQAVQMKVDYEHFVVGALFSHRFVLIEPSEVELSCFAQMLQLWRERPHIGGKAASGHGLVCVQYKCPSTPDAYLQYLEQNKLQISELLDEVGGKLGAF